MNSSPNSQPQISSHTTVYLSNILLDASNYPSWLFRVESFLRGWNLFGFVDGTLRSHDQLIQFENGNVINPEYVVWKAQDQSIVNMIGQTLGPVAVRCVVGSKSAHDMWSRLKDKFAEASKQNILQLKSNLQSIKKGSDDIETYLDKIKSAKDALDTVECYIDDEDVVMAILNGLPNDYAAIKTVIRTQYTCAPINQIKTLLKAAEMDIASDNQNIQTLLLAMLANLNVIPKSGPSSFVSSQSGAAPITLMSTLSLNNNSNSHHALVIPLGFNPPNFSPYAPTFPYGFPAMTSFPMFNPYGMSGTFAGRGSGNKNGNGGHNHGGHAHGGRNGNGNVGIGNQMRNNNANNNNGGFNGNNYNGGFKNNNGNCGASSSSVVCQWCNKTGHIAKNCRSLPSSNNQQGNNNELCQFYGMRNHTANNCYFIIGFPNQQSQQDDHTAMFAANSIGPQYWLADTGASNHMTNNLQMLNNVIPYPSDEGVQIGDGQDSVQGTE